MYPEPSWSPGLPSNVRQPSWRYSPPLHILTPFCSSTFVTSCGLSCTSPRGVAHCIQQLEVHHFLQLELPFSSPCFHCVQKLNVRHFLRLIDKLPSSSQCAHCSQLLSVSHFLWLKLPSSSQCAHCSKLLSVSHLLWLKLLSSSQCAYCVQQLDICHSLCSWPSGFFSLYCG